MNSIYSYAYRTSPHTPCVCAYYDRADMPATTDDAGMHLHSVSEFMYVVEGRASVLLHPNVRIPLSRRQFIWLDAFVAHRLILEEGAPCSMLNMEFDLVPSPAGASACSLNELQRQSEALRDMLEHPASYLVLHDEEDAVYTLLKQIILQESSAMPMHTVYSSMLSSALLLLTAQRRLDDGRPREPEVCNPHVAIALNHIQAHYCETLTAQSLADLLHIHPSYLHRLFKQHTGKTVNETIRDLRMREARKLLAQGSGSLLDVASAVGIASQQYFVKLFRQTYGQSPLEYRRSLS